MKHRFLILLAAALAATALAEDGSIDGYVVNARIDSLLDKADRLYEDEQYERAYFIYERELVPIGHKYAQYMLGYMHLVGAGVEQDPVTALAWYRLAAEVDTPEFVAVRDRLAAQLNAEQVARSADVYRELRQRYSHVALILEQVKTDREALSSRTGTRLPGSSRSLIVVDPSHQGGRSGDQYYEDVQRRFERNLAELEARLGLDDLSRSPGTLDMDRLEAAVDEYLDRLD